MAIISSIGRRQYKTKLVIWVIYSVLTMGAVSMIYPFLLMMAGSTKTAVDSADAFIVPGYLFNDVALYRKHIEGLYNENINAMQNAYGLWGATFGNLPEPVGISPLRDDWNAFLASCHRVDRPDSLAGHPYWSVLGYLWCPISRSVTPENLSKLRQEMLAEEGGISGINKKYGTTFQSASSFVVIPTNYLNRFSGFPDTPYLRRIEKFYTQQPEKWKGYLSIANFYRNFLQIKYGKDVQEYNNRKGTAFPSWNQVPVGARAEDCGPWAKNDFDEFAREIANPIFIHIDAEASGLYQDYLRKKYAGDINSLNRVYGKEFHEFSDVPLPESMPLYGSAKDDWRSFLEGWKDEATGEVIAVPGKFLGLWGPDFAFREFLQGKYGSLAKMNAVIKTQYPSWDVVEMPLQDAQFAEFQEMRPALRWEFTVRNYRSVWNYLVINGRGLVNTLIFCALAVVAALTVDPIAAYALSRFKPRSTYKIMLFLMLTMAFPTMVTQIPMFLLLRDIGLLNTFLALVLPGLANGYHIFLLKGFFDSLPRELYESAEIDGAGEFRIFWNITMALSKPILAVIALGAFTGAYAAFMFALLLCQDPKMWTLMVWLYQLQQSSGQGIVYASLIIAAFPTFFVFLICQNVIMRGIIIPVEK